MQRAGQRALADTLAALGLVAQLVLPGPRARQEMRESVFERRRRGHQTDFGKEKGPDRATDRPVFSPKQWARLLSFNINAAQRGKWVCMMQGASIGTPRWLALWWRHLLYCAVLGSSAQ